MSYQKKVELVLTKGLTKDLIFNISLSIKVINLYSSYTLDPWSRDLNIAFKSGNWLFRAVKLAKNADPDKYRCSGYCIRFDVRSQFLLPNGR